MASTATATARRWLTPRIGPGRASIHVHIMRRLLAPSKVDLNPPCRVVAKPKRGTGTVTPSQAFLARLLGGDGAR
jgi:hypothetical protein